MQRIKKRLKSNNKIKYKYNSLDEFYEEYKKDPKLLTFKDSNNEEISVEATLVTSSSKKKHLILYDKDLMKEFDQNNEMGADASYNWAPSIKGVKQVFTIMMKKYDRVLY